MDILDLDPEVLDTTAGLVEGYCNRQTAIMDEYLSNTSALASEWSDDQTFGSLLEEVKRLKDSVVTLMDEIRGTYPQYFRDRAEFIRRRPRF